MSRAGYAMFADNPTDMSSYGPETWAVRHRDLVPISDYFDKIAETWEQDKESGVLDIMLSGDNWQLMESSGEEAAQMFDPEDIYITADAWDNEDMVQWVVDRVFNFDVPGVKTQDGAIVFDESILHHIERDIYGDRVLGHELHDSDGESGSAQFSVSEGKTQDELLDFVTQFQRATEERFRDVPKESAKESAEDNAAAIRGDLDRLAELTRQSEEAQGIQRQTPEEIAESKVNARVGEEKPGFMDRLRHPGQTIRDAGESLRRTGESVRDTGRYFYRMLVDSGEAVSRVGKQSGDRMSIENMGLVENARDALAKRISRLQNRCSEKSAIRGSPPTQNHPRRLTERKLPGVCFFSRLKFQVPAELDRVIPKAADAAVGVADVRLAAGVPAYGITEAVRVEALSRFPALLAELALRVVCRLAERLKILQPLGRRRHDAHVVLPAVFVVDLRL